MHVETQFPVLAGLAVHLLGLLAPRLAVLQIAQGVADPEIVLVVYLAHVDLLQLVEELEVVEDLRVRAVADVLVGFEEDLEAAALLLALGARPRPLLDDLLGLAHGRLHEERGVVRGGDVEQGGLLRPLDQLLLGLLGELVLALHELAEHALHCQAALLERLAALDLSFQLLLESRDGLVAFLEDLARVLVVEVDEAVEVVEEMLFQCLVRLIELFVFREVGHWEPFERFKLILLVVSEVDDVFEEIQLSLQAHRLLNCLVGGLLLLADGLELLVFLFDPAHVLRQQLGFLYSLLLQLLQGRGQIILDILCLACFLLLLLRLFLGLRFLGAIVPLIIEEVGIFLEIGVRTGFQQCIVVLIIVFFHLQHVEVLLFLVEVVILLAFLCWRGQSLLLDGSRLH